MQYISSIEFKDCPELSSRSEEIIFNIGQSSTKQQRTAEYKANRHKRRRVVGKQRPVYHFIRLRDIKKDSLM
ncbi:unnamed protein product [Hermetia illucens]|uniref:Uncharacterized protein n=1 Tax=Hermetia illucens TaxID=343691 RepID=A0A7R8YQE7_HERIL|nr:unnamed protein product [Hermetia illucens]